MIVDSKTSRNDIFLDKDMWLKWVEIQPNNDAINLDDLMGNSIKEFFISLETECVSGCCGIDAFDMSTENIDKWFKGDVGHVISDFNHLVKVLNDKNNDLVISSHLNNFFDKSVFVELCNYLTGILKSRITSR